MRILVAEDSALFRAGVVRLLADAGHEVTAVPDADRLRAALPPGARPVDLLVADVRMPPSMTDDGVRAARDLRRLHPGLPVLLLSQHVETGHVADLVGEPGFGYLLKDRVLHEDDFLDAVGRVARGGSALDPLVVTALVRPRRVDDPLHRITPRELEVLELVAQGRSNAAVAAALVLAERTVETHMRSIFDKLGLVESEGSHRRVLAVLAHLTRTGRGG